jgi:hypothetical protein
VSEAELDEMTKAELLAYAREQGVSPANNDMTKDELRAAIDGAAAGEPDDQAADEADDDAEVGELVTTTMTHDYLGVPLVNATPGTSNATDRLGRNVVTGNKDFMGRSLLA